jgi:RNA polymerase sigma-70 factor (ECF subfamily)
MDTIGPGDHISVIETLWTVVRKAHEGTPQAQEELVRRYGMAAYRYLVAILRDQQEASEVLQDFWLRFLSGSFRNARPERGRFRALIKTALYHLAVDQIRKRRASPAGSLVEEVADDEEGEQQFLAEWRQKLLDRTWEALAAVKGQSRQPLYEVLRFRAQHPKLSSEEMAERLSEQLDRPLSAAGVRQVLKRAREKFAELLVQEVALTLAEPSAEELEEEVSELGLLSYCRSALGRRPAAGP